MVKVGIPRGLMYYEYYIMWKTFLENIGVQVVVSDKTTKPVLNDGVNCSVDEACLPVKLFHGHVINLKHKVDYLFIPRLKSVAKGEYICPKFIGLPEMIRFSIKSLPPIIDVEMNVRKNEKEHFKAFECIGKMFDVHKKQTKDAYQAALKAHEHYVKEMFSGRYPIDILEDKQRINSEKELLTIGLIAHGYNLYDRYISMDILEKLQQKDIRVITPETISEKHINAQANTLQKKMFWTSGRRLLGSVLHLMEQAEVDGIIYLMSFGCGVDAFISDLSERKIRRYTNIPFCLLTLDEHSGEAGFDTRLEAFIDMIKWRKKDASYVSAHG